MSDIVERLRVYASDDHERGCQGRYYDCSCGYDGKRDPLLDEAAARITQLEAALREIEYLDRPQSRGLPRRVSIQDIARAALEDRT